MNNQIGITERGDASLNLNWKNYVNNGHPTILITKNPIKLYEILKNSNLLNKDNYIVHCTITGYGNSIIEPNVVAPELAIKYYKEFCKIIGNKRTVLRVDPIFPTEKGIKIAEDIIKNSIENNLSRVRVSFIDLYPHVKSRLHSAKIYPSWQSFHAPLKLRLNAFKHIQSICSTIEICGEPDIKCTGCVSDIDCELLRVTPNNFPLGQRSSCECLSNKVELLNDRFRCQHKCLYCYWKDE